MKKAVIFDFDGTIANSFDIFFESLIVASGQEHKLTPEQISDMHKSSISQIAKELGVKKWQLPFIMRKGRKQISNRAKDISVFQDMPDLLAQLSLGYKLYILSSNGQQNIETVLKKYSIDKYITKIYANISLNGKAGGLKKLMRQQHLDPQDCVYVSDQIRDIEAAKKANVECISVAWGYTDPYTLISNNFSIIAYKPADILHFVVHDNSM